MPMKLWAIWLSFILEPPRHAALELPWFFTQSSILSSGSEGNESVLEGVSVAWTTRI